MSAAEGRLSLAEVAHSTGSRGNPLGKLVQPIAIRLLQTELVPGNGNLQAETTAPKRPLKSN